MPVRDALNPLLKCIQSGGREAEAPESAAAAVAEEEEEKERN